MCSRVGDRRVEPLAQQRLVLRPQRARGRAVRRARRAAPRSPARPARRARRGRRRAAAPTRAASSRSRSASACGVERAAVLGEQVARAARRRTARRRGAPPTARRWRRRARRRGPARTRAPRRPRPRRCRAAARWCRARRPVAAARAQQLRRRVAGVAPAQPAALERSPGTPARTGPRAAASAGSRWSGAAPRPGAVAVERARLDEEAHHRGGRRDLEPAAADVADEQPEPAARQRPDPEHVAAAGLRGRPARRRARPRGRRARGGRWGTKPAVIARATRRSRS